MAERTLYGYFIADALWANKVNWDLGNFGGENPLGEGDLPGVEDNVFLNGTLAGPLVDTTVKSMNNTAGADAQNYTHLFVTALLTMNSGTWVNAAPSGTTFTGAATSSCAKSSGTYNFTEFSNQTGIISGTAIINLNGAGTVNTGEVQGGTLNVQGGCNSGAIKGGVCSFNYVNNASTNIGAITGGYVSFDAASFKASVNRGDGRGVVAPTLDGRVSYDGGTTWLYNINGPGMTDCIGANILAGKTIAGVPGTLAAGGGGGRFPWLG